MSSPGYHNPSVITRMSSPASHVEVEYARRRNMNVQRYKWIRTLIQLYIWIYIKNVYIFIHIFIHWSAYDIFQHWDGGGQGGVSTDMFNVGEHVLRCGACSISVQSIGGGRGRFQAEGRIDILPPNDHQQIAQIMLPMYLDLPGCLRTSFGSRRFFFDVRKYVRRGYTNATSFN